MSAPWTSPPAPTRTRPPAPRPAAQRRRLDAWRERGADHGSRALPFHGSAGARAAPHAGAARALDQRLAALLDAYAADLERDEAAPGSPAPEPSQAPGRDIWAKVSANRQLRQSEQQVPDNAGPLITQQPALALMRQLSPGYLHQFLSYLDALAWMEQFDGAVAAAKPRAVRPRLAPRVQGG